METDILFLPIPERKVIHKLRRHASTPTGFPSSDAWYTFLAEIPYKTFQKDDLFAAEANNVVGISLTPETALNDLCHILKGSGK